MAYSTTSVDGGVITPYRTGSGFHERSAAGTMGLVFVAFAFVLYLASEASASGSTFFAILVTSFIVVLFTLIDVEFGIYCLVAGMLLSPEIPLDFFTLPGRKVVVRIDDIMIIIVSLAWFAQTAVRGEIQLLQKTPLNKPIIWFSALTMISTVRGIFTGSVGHGLTAFFYVLKFLEFFLLYALIVNNIGSETQVRRIMSAYFVTLIAVLAWVIWTVMIEKRFGRATTPFESAEEPGTLGGYLLFSFALAFGLLTSTPSLIGRIFYLGLMMAIIPPFLYTLSRGSYMAFAPMFITVLLFSRNKVIPVLLLVVMLVALPWLPSVTVERIEYTFQNRLENVFSTDPDAEVELDPSSAARLERYEGVINQWMYRPLLGQGVTGVGFVDGQIVRVLGEVGILGLLALISIFKNFIQTAILLYRRLQDGYLRGLILGMISGTVGLIFHGATANTFTVVRIAGPFWLVVGLVMVIYKIHEAEFREEGMRSRAA